MSKSRVSRGQRPGSSIDEEKRTELFSKLYEACETARRSSETLSVRTQPRREIEELCSRHPFLARERSRMVKELQRTQVVVARRARRGEPLVPVKVIKANGRLRKFGVTLPTGRAPRQATNARRRGSCRTAAPTRAGPDEGDADPPGVSHPPARRETAGGAS